MPEGNHTLIASYVSYLQNIPGVAVQGNNETVVDILLDSDDITLQEVE